MLSHSPALATLSARRVFAFTHLNAHSSRSHAVVMLTAVKVGVGRSVMTPFYGNVRGNLV